MAAKGYGAIALTGGGVGALDAINGALLVDGDTATVFDHSGQKFYVYTLDASSGAAESSPDIIAPDTNPGTKRWLLCHLAPNNYIYTLLLNANAADFVADTGMLALANEYTKNQNLDEVTLTDGTTAVDFETDGNSYLLLEENTTLSAPSNLVAGRAMWLRVLQDGTGGWTLSFNVAYDFESYDSEVNTTASKTTIYVFWTDGTKVYARIWWKED